MEMFDKRMNKSMSFISLNALSNARYDGYNTNHHGYNLNILDDDLPINSSVTLNFPPCSK